MTSSVEQGIQRADAVFAALAHPARRQILLSVHYRGSCTAGDIANRFECSWPTTSRHLSTLVSAGLLHVEKHGRQRTYSADAQLLREVLIAWSEYFETVKFDNTGAEGTASGTGR